jgi:hypothetical protein
MSPLSSVQVCKLAMPATFSILISCLTYSANLKTKATCSSEISVDFQRATRRGVPYDRTPQLPECSTLIAEKQPLQKERFIGRSRNYSKGTEYCGDPSDA